MMENFHITTDSAAEWALEQIRDINAECDRLVKVAIERMEYYHAFVKETDRKANDKKAYFVGLLLEYFQNIPVKTAKTQETYKLPSGKLVKTLPKRDFTLVDEAAAIEALRGTEYIKTEEKVKWGEFKKTLRFAPDGETVITGDGEVIEGLSFVDKPEKFEVKLS